jgi:arylsulfatase A-like enzyme
MLFSLLLGCSWLSGPPALPPGGARPDIVLVSIDTLRADHLGAYGYTARETSPFLDGLAAGGVRAEHFRSPCPWTLPSHTTLFTGMLPQTHRVVDDDVKVDLSLPVLPEVLRGRGYATGGFVSTMYVSRKFGFERGFDAFDDFGLTTEKENLKGEVDAEDVVDAALEFLEGQQGKEAFVFLHLYDAHYPYAPPSPHDERFDRPSNDDDLRYRKYSYFKKNPPTPEQMAHQVVQYDEEIRYLDGELARLKAVMDEAGREAIWIVTADHGEEFLERGSWGHAHTLYPEQLRIPLIMAGPGLPEGAVMQGVAGLHDLAATVSALTGEPMGGDGVDLSPYLSGSIRLPDRAFVSGTSRFKTNRIGLWEDGLRLDWDLVKRSAELYADALEEDDVARERREDVRRLQGRLTDLLGAPWEASSGPVTVSQGVALADGQLLASPLKVSEPLSFAVVPADAEVTVDGQGPFRAAGGPLPGEGLPLRYAGQQLGSAAELSDADRERLKLLGYVQDDEE